MARSPRHQLHFVLALAMSLTLVLVTSMASRDEAIIVHVTLLCVRWRWWVRRRGGRRSSSRCRWGLEEEVAQRRCHRRRRRHLTRGNRRLRRRRRMAEAAGEGAGAVAERRGVITRALDGTPRVGAHAGSTRQKICSRPTSYLFYIAKCAIMCYNRKSNPSWYYKWVCDIRGATEGLGCRPATPPPPWIDPPRIDPPWLDPPPRAPL
jgi:hypothetical protein